MAGAKAEARGWPPWAKGLASVVVAGHLMAVLAAAMAASPASEFQRWLAGNFFTYNQVIDQGYSYRYYVNGPPPTPILLATLQFADGRTEELRIPDRSLRPRLRFQRHLALAYHLRQDVGRAPRDEQGNSRSRWAQSYARHLGREHPGCQSVTFHLTDHLNPTPEELMHAAAEGELPLDTEAPRFYTVPERVGEYPCRD